MMQFRLWRAKNAEWFRKVKYSTAVFKKRGSTVTHLTYEEFVTVSSSSSSSSSSSPSFPSVGVAAAHSALRGDETRALSPAFGGGLGVRCTRTSISSLLFKRSVEIYIVLFFLWSSKIVYVLDARHRLMCLFCFYFFFSCIPWDAQV